MWPRKQFAWGRCLDESSYRKVRENRHEGKGCDLRKVVLASVDKKKRKLLRKVIITSALNTLHQPFQPHLWLNDTWIVLAHPITYSAWPWNEGWYKFIDGESTTLHVEGQDWSKSTIRGKRSPVNRDQIPDIRKHNTHIYIFLSVKGFIGHS